MAEQIKATDYAMEQTTRNAAELFAMKERLHMMDIVIKDLAYILNELLADNANPAHDGYREALEGHLAMMEEGA